MPHLSPTTLTADEQRLILRATPGRTHQIELRTANGSSLGVPGTLAMAVKFRWRTVASV